MIEEGKWTAQNRLPFKVTFEGLRDGLGRALLFFASPRCAELKANI